MHQHSFDVEIARIYGVNCAIILRYLQFWIDHNRARGLNYRDGLYWTYNSVHAMAEAFPYMSERQIKSALKQLREEGIIIAANYNRTSRDRTLWYAITEYGESVLQNPACALIEEEDIPDDTDDMGDMGDMGDMNSAPEEGQNSESNIQQNYQNQNCQILPTVLSDSPIGQNEPMHWIKMSNASDKMNQCIGQNEPMHRFKMSNASVQNVQPLPVIYTDIYTDRDTYRERGRARACVDSTARVDGTHMRPPSPDEVRAYVAENGYAVDAQRFWDYYEAVNWRSNGEPIRNWQAKVRNWASREGEFRPRAPDNPATDYTQRAFSDTDLQFFDVFSYYGDDEGGITT